MADSVYPEAFDAIEDAYPLTRLETGMLFHSEYSPETAIYHDIFSFVIRAPFDHAALERSVQQLSERHPVLRTAFDLHNFSEPLQLVYRGISVPLAVEDQREQDGDAQQAALAAWTRIERSRSFDWSQPPLLRFQVHRLADETFQFTLSFHHAILDGWSVATMLSELFQIYLANLGRPTPPLPPPPIVSFRDVVALERQALQSEEHRQFWARMIAGADVTLVPRWSPARPPLDAVRQLQRHSIALSADLGEALHLVAQSLGVPIKSVLLAAHIRALALLSGQNAVMTGLVSNSRPEQADGERGLGLFLNTLPFRMELAGGSWRDLVRATYQAEQALLPYRHFPLAEIQKLRGGQPLFETAFNFVHFHIYQKLAAFPELEVLSGGSFEETNFTFLAEFSLNVHARQIHLDLVYDIAMLCAEQIAQIGGYYTTIFTAIARDTDSSFAGYPLLATEERRRIVETWNATERPYPADRLIHDLFEAQVDRDAAALAALTDDRRLTYGELEQQANRLAHHLRGLGIGPGGLVAVYMHRALEMLPALLGILKAGGAYVPLETSFPAARVEWILSTLEVGCIITQHEHLPAIRACAAQAPALQHIICLDRQEPDDPAQAALHVWTLADLNACPDTRPAALSTPDDIAYIIFTSGSTGQPKGVVLRHRPVINLIDWVNRTFAVGPADRVLFITSLCFDLSVYDIFGLLAAGGSVRIVSDRDLHEPEELLRMLCQEPITFWDSAPAALQQLAPFFDGASCAASTLRLAFLSGDWIPVTLPDRLRACFPSAQVIGLGGATEAAIWSNYYPIDVVNPDWVSIPYGRPIQNARYYILDQALNPCPIGVPGDLYIGGECLASGYARDAALTAQKFVPDPFYRRAGAVMYRTGDRARFWPDGVMEFLGRVDFQVKVRGFRIELGEIEAALAQHPAVRECLVLAREDTPGEKRLVAYIVPTTDDRRPTTVRATGWSPQQGDKETRGQGDEDHATRDTQHATRNTQYETPSSILHPPSSIPGELRAFLKERLPAYMIPAAFVMLDAMPLTPNGKVDRKALPALDTARPTLERTFEAPHTPIEQQLAELWAELLRLDQVGIHDNFLELGGDSILSLQIVTQANRRGLRITPRQIFENPTIAELAAVVSTAGLIQAEQELVLGPLPLTPIQRWFFDQKLADPHHFNQAVLLETAHALDPELLAQVLRLILRHHDALRLRFVHDGQAWQQVCVVPDEDVHLAQIDLSGRPPEEQRAALEQAATGIQGTLNLSDGPLLRAALFDLGPDRPGRLLIVVHHLAIDGVSWRILLEDLQLAYEQLAAGLTPRLPRKTTSFKQWAERLAEHASGEELWAEGQAWLDQAQFAVPVLPRDFLARQGDNTRGAARTFSAALGQEETEALLQEVPSAYHTQINDVLLTALAQTFAGWTGAPTLLLDLELHGRAPFSDDLDVSRTVGWFTTLFPLTLTLPDGATPGEALTSVRDQLDRIQVRGFNYGLLRYMGGALAGQLAALPQAEVSFNYLGQLDQIVEHSTLVRAAAEAVGSTASPRGARRYGLEIIAMIADSRLQTIWTYGERLHRRETIERLALGFLAALHALIEHCRSVKPAAYTPAAFPDVELTDEQFDRLLAELKL
jgi:microcystin synthetase protein McyA